MMCDGKIIFLNVTTVINAQINVLSENRIDMKRRRII